MRWPSRSRVAAIYVVYTRPVVEELFSFSMSPNWIESQKSCQGKYPDFEYKLWTDATFREFLALEYPWYSESWDNYAFPIQRADSLRYFVLYHYGGLCLDMDIYCNQTIPIQQLELGSAQHNAIFQSTLPTGVTNDFMISSARHPAYALLISKLPVYYRRTRFWARMQPYCNIMMAAGPISSPSC